MPVNERRQHFRIDDKIYMDYRIITATELQDDKHIERELMSQSNQQYMETSKYFQEIDQEISQVNKTLVMKDPAVAHYLNLLNAKVDFISRNLLVGERISLRKVNLSLGGIKFQCRENMHKNTMLKIVLYTKPKMIPIIVNASCVNSRPHSPDFFSAACHFMDLTLEQEQLLAQHIMHAQIKEKADS